MFANPFCQSLVLVRGSRSAVFVGSISWVQDNIFAARSSSVAATTLELSLRPEFDMPPPSSSSSKGNAFASSQGNIRPHAHVRQKDNAFASSQGNVCPFRVVSYNIGAGEEHSFQGKVQSAFSEKLLLDLGEFRHADVICFQEISARWGTFIECEMPGWKLWQKDKKAMLYQKNFDLEEGHWIEVFPEAESVQRKFRGFLMAMRV